MAPSSFTYTHPQETPMPFASTQTHPAHAELSASLAEGAIEPAASASAVYETFLEADRELQANPTFLLHCIQAACEANTDNPNETLHAITLLQAAHTQAIADLQPLWEAFCDKDHTGKVTPTLEAVAAI